MAMTSCRPGQSAAIQLSKQRPNTLSHAYLGFRFTAG
jgi:hypothetical protein